jgi:MFS family permease
VRLIDFMRAIRDYWPGSILWVNVAFGVCMCVPFGFLPSFVDAERLTIPGFSPIGLFFLGYAGWGLVLRVGLRRVPDRLGRRKVMLAGMSCMTLGMFAFTIVSAERSWLLVVPALICGSGHALIFHTMTSLAVETFPSDVRGTASSLSLMMMDLGMIGGAPILGQIAQAFGYQWMFAAVGMLCCGVAGLYCRASVPVWRARRLATE